MYGAEKSRDRSLCHIYRHRGGDDARSSNCRILVNIDDADWRALPAVSLGSTKVQPGRNVQGRFSKQVGRTNTKKAG